MRFGRPRSRGPRLSLTMFITIGFVTSSACTRIRIDFVMRFVRMHFMRGRGFVIRTRVCST